MTGFTSKPISMDGLRSALADIPAAPISNVAGSAGEVAGAEAALNAVHPAVDEVAAGPTGEMSVVSAKEMARVLDTLAGALGATTVADFISVFKESAAETIARMGRATGAGDVLMLAQEAHAMAGSAACVGLGDLATFARAFEHALRSGPVPDAGPAHAVSASSTHTGT